jgi:murein DD-endopeptidase MepM/ murein hydrolase activator NlpD
MSFDFKNSSHKKQSKQFSSILNYKPNLAFNSNKSSLVGGYLSSINSSFLNSGIDSVNNRFNNSKINLLALLICFFNFLTHTRNYIIYKTYKQFTRLWSFIIDIPNTLIDFKDNIQDNIQILSFSDTRELWWIERKIDFRSSLKYILSLNKITQQIIYKTYLFFIVITSLFILNTNSIISKNSSSNVFEKFIGKHINNNIEQTNPVLLSSTVINASAVGLENQQPIISIIEHTVTPKDTLESLSNLYSITTDTIKFNNTNIKDGNLTIDSKIYLPWMNGYIYRTSTELSPEEISKIYNVDAQSIARENKATLNPQNNKFNKESLVLLPTTDFAKVIDTNNKIVSQKAEAEAARQKLLSEQSISTESQVFDTKTNASSGFIWPTQGVISRCLQPGHIACDIANASGPDIVAVQSGVISDVYHFTVYGYGNAVVVDHGNGLKTLYAHMETTYVNQGQQVNQGTALGKMGCTGLCTGTHVHFEVKVNGVNQNPLAYLP